MRNLRNVKSQLKKAIITFIVMLGVIFSSLTIVAPVTNAQDHDRYRDHPRYEERERDYARIEYRRGFNDGLDRGREDAREHRRFEPYASRRFREGSRHYREGFMNGYRQGYRDFSRGRR